MTTYNTPVVGSVEWWSLSNESIFCHESHHSYLMCNKEQSKRNQTLSFFLKDALQTSLKVYDDLCGQAWTTQARDREEGPTLNATNTDKSYIVYLKYSYNDIYFSIIENPESVNFNFWIKSILSVCALETSSFHMTLV